MTIQNTTHPTSAHSHLLNPKVQMGPYTHKNQQEILANKPLCPSLHILGSSSVVMKAKTKSHLPLKEILNWL